MSIDDKAEYYDAGGIETMDIIRAKLTDEQFKGFLLGNALKYLCRMNFKGCSERDAEKAEKYCRMLDKHHGKEKGNPAKNLCDTSSILQWDTDAKQERCFGCKHFGLREAGRNRYSVICTKNQRGLHSGYASESEVENTLTPDWCPGRDE